MLVVVILIFVSFKGNSFVKLEMTKSDSLVVLNVIEVVLLGVEIMVVCMKKEYTVLPHIVCTKAILFCIWKLWQIQIVVAIFQLLYYIATMY